MKKKIEEIIKNLHKLSYEQIDFILLLIKSYLSK